VTERTAELSAALDQIKETSGHAAAERLRAFGEMAGGVVHDFNNALMSVIATASLSCKIRPCSKKSRLFLVTSKQ